ncbi:Wadjet anti-phage system protein JetD domain-containing protein [Acidithiobacillus sp.]
MSLYNTRGGSELTLLTEEEQQLYRDLKQQRWGQNVRLEQERIDWATAWSALQRSIS